MLNQTVKNQVLKLSLQNKSKKEITDYIKKETGLKDSQARYWRKKICENSDNNIQIEKKDNQCVVKSNNQDIKTLDELLDFCNVDLSIWEVEKFTLKKNDVTIKQDGEQTVVPRFQIEGWLKRKSDVSSVDLLQQFVDNANIYSPKTFLINKNNKKDTNYLYEIGIFDLHLAKLAWGRSTGFEDYDIDIASNLFKNAINDLISKVKIDKVERILFPVGNDFFQFDNENSETTAGTFVDSDSRWQKMFLRGCELLTESVTNLSQICPIDVVIVPGNHDTLSTQYLGYYLQAWFRNNKNVVIDNEPTSRKYYRYGQNLIGFEHGKEVKAANLPLIMATERKKDWGETKYRELQIGHWHHESLKEITGVKVRIMPSLCSSDQWHSTKGFIGNIRSAEGLLFHKDNGLEAIYYFNL